MHLQSSKEKFNCRDRLGGCLELIQSPHLSFFFPTSKSSNSFRLFGDRVFDGKKIFTIKIVLQKMLITGYNTHYTVDSGLLMSDFLLTAVGTE